METDGLLASQGKTQALGGQQSKNHCSEVFNLSILGTSMMTTSAVP